MRAPRFLVLALGLTGCAGYGASQEQLVSRATFDLECPKPQVRVLDLGKRVRGVEGCNRRLSYVEVCEVRPDGTHCTWVINAPAWAYGPPNEKRPPTPPGTWFYTTPPPSGPPGAGVPSVPAAVPPPAPPPPASPPTVEAPAPMPSAPPPAPSSPAPF